MAQARIEAPAKINVHLEIRGRRPDGFHDLESVFLETAFGDSLLITEEGPEHSCEIAMHWEPPLRAGELKDNIIAGVVNCFRKRTFYRKGLRIAVEKRIPVGSGMGGSSSDAAGVLVALNALSGSCLAEPELLEMAAELGSDVPFFIRGGAALVRGRGEILESLPLPPGLKVVLVNPLLPSSSAEAFRLLDRKREGGGELPRGKGLSDPVEWAALLEGPPGEWPFWNDFLPLFLEKETPCQYAKILGDLKESGAEFAGLSGSGSTCFGIYSDGGEAKKAFDFLLKRWFFVKLTFFLANKGLEVVRLS
ncbi:MAG: 4-(cytidine 5'-diphospho)-2-C-methyl-D-erythritol kinase [Treponema sp.]|jgi:4-diphosphocytidyl-2-C-methyl-D-erythritol kinase|nr:4-(cytidine 5'-diphospho)-2-C-methyl-D-erythritol kinase [Treponema sp.]